MISKDRGKLGKSSFQTYFLNLPIATKVGLKNPPFSGGEICNSTAMITPKPSSNHGYVYISPEKLFEYQETKLSKLVDELERFNASHLIPVLSELERDELAFAITLGLDSLKSFLFRNKQEVDMAISKLSCLQKTVLIKALQKEKNQGESIKWEPVEWFPGKQSPSERASLSRCLTRLRERNLIIKQRIPCSNSPRTHQIKFTKIGRKVAKRLTRIEISRQTVNEN